MKKNREDRNLTYILIKSSLTRMEKPQDGETAFSSTNGVGKTRYSNTEQNLPLSYTMQNQLKIK